MPAMTSSNCLFALLVVLAVKMQNERCMAVGKSGPSNFQRDTFVDSDAPANSMSTCAMRASYAKILPRDMPSPSCISLIVIEQIECAEGVNKVQCNQCTENVGDKNAAVPTCYQTFANHWVPLLCQGGLHWIAIKVPSGCSCFIRPPVQI
ncbi:unnamed protein product [Owenia fusiformis]|uniref:Uncharacterized protein n=1 Tax=Owenia fusiformis TaxID=6347 RepID=A0A8S4PT50_OWEFU|nr:unnamed protein product [Owenia fusiformis]